MTDDQFVDITRAGLNNRIPVGLRKPKIQPWSCVARRNIEK